MPETFAASTLSAPGAPERRTVALLGTLDTKGREFAFLRETIRRHGLETLVIDASVLGEPAFPPDIDRRVFFAAGGFDADALRRKGDRGEALAAAVRSAEVIARKLHGEGRIHGLVSLGGSGGTSIATAAMRALPVGVPKLMVSTMASGDTRPYVGIRDVCMMYSVVDISGINRLSRSILANAANAIAGMVAGAEPMDYANGVRPHFSGAEGAGLSGAPMDYVNGVRPHLRPLVGMTMFGVTTPCVEAVRKILEASGYECLVFHATGTGGRAMEGLVEDGFLAGVCDVTTTEWADELVGGVLSAGPARLEAAGKKGIPQVVSVGALDMVNFGPRDTVPAKFAGRKFYPHNPTVTLMRTTVEENRRLGEILAEKLNAAKGPVKLFLPLRGLSAIDREGQPFDDPAARAALYAAIERRLDRKKIDLVKLDLHINDPAFAEAMAKGFLELMTRRQAEGQQQ